MEIEQLKQKQLTTSVTYTIGSDYSHFPGFLLIISRLCNFKNGGWLGISSTGLLIFQPLCVMLGPASTGIVFLNPLNGEYKSTICSTYVHLKTHCPYV